MPRWVQMDDWIIPTICKHIVSNKPLTGRRIRISVNEPSCGWVIIAGLEVIEAAFGIKVIATVTKWVFLGQDTGSGQDLAVGVIGITRHGIATGIHHTHHVALQVGHIVIGGFIDLHSVRLAGVVIEEVMGLGGPAGRYLYLAEKLHPRIPSCPLDRSEIPGYTHTHTKRDVKKHCTTRVE